MHHIQVAAPCPAQGVLGGLQLRSREIVGGSKPVWDEEGGERSKRELYISYIYIYIKRFKMLHLWRLCNQILSFQLSVGRFCTPLRPKAPEGRLFFFFLWWQLTQVFCLAPKTSESPGNYRDVLETFHVTHFLLGAIACDCYMLAIPLHFLLFPQHFQNSKTSASAKTSRKKLRQPAAMGCGRSSVREVSSADGRFTEEVATDLQRQVSFNSMGDLPIFGEDQSTHLSWVFPEFFSFPKAFSRGSSLLSLHLEQT